jgi:arylsulfatase
LQDLFWVEAAKYDVLPLDDRGISARLAPGERPDPLAGRTRFTFYPGAVRIPEGAAPDLKNISHAVTVDLTVPKGEAEGVLVAQGGVSAGWALLVKDGKLTYTYNYLLAERPTIAAKSNLPEGDTTVRFEFAYDGGGFGKGGIVSLFVNGNKVGEGRIEKTVPAGFSAEETLDVGRDTGSPVGDYEAPFPFTGTIKKVEIALGSP